VAQLSEIAALEEHRRRLIAESDRLRQQVAGELARLHTAAAWLDRGHALVQSTRYLWPFIAGAAGFFVTRKRRGVLGTVTRILSWWRLGKRLVGLWGLLSAQSPACDKPT
jgi:hypothetical protein